jgi:hypothetical protein
MVLRRGFGSSLEMATGLCLFVGLVEHTMYFSRRPPRSVRTLRAMNALASCCSMVAPVRREHRGRAAPRLRAVLRAALGKLPSGAISASAILARSRQI